MLFHNIEEVKEEIKKWKKAGLTVGLVPTMGALHNGHLSLIKKAKENCDKVVVSDFVNPIQFGPSEDFDKYPRTLDKDVELCNKEGVDIVFAPSPDERIRLAAFYDFGWLGENGNVYNYPKEFLHSVGFGTYITFADWLTTQIGVGFPLGEKRYGEGTARFYFSVNGDLDRLIPLRNPQKL